MNRSILIVDDEPDMCEFITDVADDLGFQTKSTSNPLEFPVHYSKDLDCIVMDLCMPDMDGVELIRFLGDNRCTASIIVISGMDNGIISTAEKLARDQGLNILGGLSKPISITALEDLLKNVPTNQHDKIPQRKQSNDNAESNFPSVEELSKAIEKKEIVPFFQPQTRADNNELQSVEALARWVHPEKGIIPPFQFIDFAEKEGLIDKLTLSMFEQVVEHLAEWKAIGLNIGCSINFSAQSLSNLDLPDILFSLASKHGISPTLLTVEMTESALLDKGHNYLDVFTRLRMKGFKLSIDDFGTGFSSMKQLQNIPFNEVKIDRSFVMDVLHNESSKTIVQSTTELAHRLSMSIVSEGIEDQETLDFLANLGSDLIQGYFISPPLPNAEFKAWATNREKP